MTKHVEDCPARKLYAEAHVLTQELRDAEQPAASRALARALQPAASTEYRANVATFVHLAATLPRKLRRRAQATAETMLQMAETMKYESAQHYLDSEALADKVVAIWQATSGDLSRKLGRIAQQLQVGDAQVAQTELRELLQQPRTGLTDDQFSTLQDVLSALFRRFKRFSGSLLRTPEHYQRKEHTADFKS